MTRSASSNCVGLERWVMSPVWMMKAGRTGRALTLAIASSSVPLALGLAGLSKPIWLSLSWRNVRPAGSAAGSAVQALRAGNAAAHRIGRARACPGHAFRHPAAG